MRPWTYINPAEDPLVIACKIFGVANNRLLAAELGWSEGKTSRRVDELEAKGKVIKARAGKSVAIMASS